MSKINKQNKDSAKSSEIASNLFKFWPCWKLNCASFPSIHLILLVLLAFSFASSHAFAQYYSAAPLTSTTNSSLIVGNAVSSDGSVHVTITSTPIEADQPLALQISFTDPRGNPIPYENYGIRAQQIEGTGVLILSNMSSLAVNGKDIQVTYTLQNVSPVNFQVQLQGSGPPNTSPTEWTGPNEIVSITLGGQYSYHTAVSQAPAGTNQVVTIPYGAYDPNYNTAAPFGMSHQLLPYL
ncbi:MAG: hypothetical protein ACREBA_01110 [Nitrosotalea sp.]